MIEIGGIHVEPAKPVEPDDVREFLDSADEGVILFTMGSILNGTNWPIDKRDAFVRAFGKLGQKVLWKYENDTIPNNPGNIMVKSWLPQRDILAHPNIRAFITHGGLLGATEAMVEGVPFLGIPIYADQKLNVLTAEKKGYGILMEYDNVNQELIEEKLRQILANPKYQESAKLYSKRFNDRITSPEETTVYWVEYVIRHGGAPHMTSPAHKLNYIQRNLIDVYGFLFLILFLVVSVNLWILKNFISRLTSSSSKKYKEN